MKSFSRKCVSLLVAGVMAAGLASAAQAYPDEPIFMVVPYPPGGPNDILARSINEKMGELLGQPVVIDNRGGAGGNVGTDYVVSADNDGHTILLHGMGVAVNPSLYPDATYHPLEDLEPVAMVAQTPLVMVVPASLPADSVEEFLDYARQRPSELNFGSGGAGTSLHLAAERFLNVADLDMTHIPYRGNAMVMPDLLSGNVDVLFSSISTALPHIQSGDLKALAVTTSTRSETLPDVPTVAEAGLPDYEFGAWYAIVAPKGTPQEIRQQLNDVVVSVLETPEVREKLAGLGANPVTWSVEETGQFIAKEYETWRNLIEEAGISIN